MGYGVKFVFFSSFNFFRKSGIKVSICQFLKQLDQLYFIKDEELVYLSDM